MVKADFLFSILLAALGAAVCVQSWRMPRLEALGVNPWSVPGLTPGLIGAVLLLLGAILLLRSAKAGGWRLAGGGAASEDAERAGQAGRFLLALLLTLGYAAGLVGRLPFWLASFLFVLAFIVAFQWRDARRGGTIVRSVTLATLQAALVSAVVTAAFQYLFLVRLP